MRNDCKTEHCGANRIQSAKIQRGFLKGNAGHPVASVSAAIRQIACTSNADQPVGAAVCSPLLNERRYIGGSISTQFLTFRVSS